MVSDTNEEIWLTYEGILSEVEDEYKAKFDATETVKQWAVARRMFEAGRRNVIQELIENVPEGLWGFSPSEQEAVSEWLKSQMEGE